MIQRDKVHKFGPWRWVLAIAVLVVTAGSCLGAEPAVKPPDFETGYKPPITQTPPADHVLRQYADAVLLAAALAAAAFIALKLRRRWAMLILACASLAYFGFVRHGCVCAVGSLQNVVMAASDGAYAIPLVVIAFFLLPLIAALLWGRVFCGAVCPLGAIQEFFAWWPIRLPRWLSSSLGFFRYVYLAAAVVLASTGAAFVICRYDPFVAIFRLSGQANMLILGACVLVVGVFISRPYCRFVCPYGVLLGWASRLSWKRVTITPDECIQCRLCEDACPNDAIDKANAEAPPRGRALGRPLLVGLIIAMPVIVAAGGYAGYFAGPVFSRVHPQVALERTIAAEQAAGTGEFSDASTAFRNTGRKLVELQNEAAGLKGRFIIAGTLAGGFLGLIITLKLIALSVRRRRTDYEANRSDCLACGRCFARCPIELKRRGEAGAESST